MRIYSVVLISLRGPAVGFATKFFVASWNFFFFLYFFDSGRSGYCMERRRIIEIKFESAFAALVARI